MNDLTKLRDMVKRARSLQMTLNNLEERLKQTGEELRLILQTEMPDLMNELGVPSLTIEPEGNEPGFAAELKPYYSANIAASWTEERRKAAFSALEDLGAGDLIKVAVEFNFAKGQLEKARALAEANAKLGPKMKQTVHQQTLTAWLREQVEEGRQLPELETIGARIGQHVKLKEV